MHRLHHLLPQFRVSGWTPDWYDGFPAYQFYMVVPSLMIVALNVGLQWWAAIPVILLLYLLPLAGWTRRQWFDRTGLPWVPTSPNVHPHLRWYKRRA